MFVPLKGTKLRAQRPAFTESEIMCYPFGRDKGLQTYMRLYSSPKHKVVPFKGTKLSNHSCFKYNVPLINATRGVV